MPTSAKSRPEKKNSAMDAPVLDKPAPHGGWPLLSSQSRRFDPGSKVDLASLARELVETLERLQKAASEDPFSNPVMLLALDITRRLERGELNYGTLEQLIQHLTAEGFQGRAARLARYLGTADSEANAAQLKERIRSLAVSEGAETPVPFEEFKLRVEREIFGIVITAHPTFNLTGDLMEILNTLATGQAGDGTPLSEAGRSELIADMAAKPHRPDENLTLAREHELSLVAIGHVQSALRRLYTLVFEVAEAVYPDRWTELTPKLITVASWVGYDLDGRSDIRWTDTLRKRLIVQEAQLRRYRDDLRSIRPLASWDTEERHTLDLLESRLALAINEVADEIEVFSADPLAEDSHQHIQRIARRMYEGLSLRLTDASPAIELIDRIVRLTRNKEGEDIRAALRRLCVLRAEIANYGLGMAHTHVRINATQLHNAIRKTVGMETAPDDPRYRQSYLAAVNDLLDRAKPATINFGSIIAERTSAKRLFMVVAQMLKYADSTTPVRFLIAECETAFTVLAALYYAKLFGIEDRVDISPLFETEKALEMGSRVIDQLLDNPHYRAYVRKRGRLCIQTGYSDSGRYLGQTPAAASIERLKMRLARLFTKHGLTDVQLVVFDTHGESIGRGAHPASFQDRLSYVATPYSLGFLTENGIDYKQETSFQGGDGYLPLVTPAGAFAVVSRIVEFMLDHYGPTRRNADESDPFYDDPDYITEFFTTAKEFQVGLMRDPNYAQLLSAIGPGLLYPSGSRAFKRQTEGSDTPEQQSASQIRAIPHNAILQQLGLPANTIAGIGEAIEKDPERFLTMYTSSARFRQLIGMVEYGFAISAPDALRAYIDSLDPGTWLLRAAKEPERTRTEEMHRLASHLEDGQLHTRQFKVFRRLFGDWCALREGLAMTGSPGAGSLLDPEARTAISLLHAIRLSLIHEIYRLATHIPQFSSQHNTTHDRLVARILHLDVPAAVDLLRRIFPAEADTRVDGDFGEKATYVSDETQNYRQENVRIFDPMTGLYDLVRRVGIALVHRIGFLG